MTTLIVVLVGQGGELDRREIAYRNEVTFADLAAACGDWIVADGDTIRVREKETAETAEL